MIEIIAQGIGLGGMACNCLSYQQKKRGTVIAFQFLGSLLFTVHFLMMGAPMGALLNGIGIVRAAVFLYPERLRTRHPLWSIGFIMSYLVAYALTFTVFGKEASVWNLIFEMLPVIGMTAVTLSFRATSAKMIRRIGLISSPCWLIYNLTVPSIGGAACEIINLASVVIGMLRLDRKENDNAES